MKINSLMPFLGSLAILPAAMAQVIVYDNTSNDLNTRLIAGSAEVGDQIILEGSGRSVSEFAFQYFAETLGGNEQFRVRFYANDGAPIGGNPPTPSTVLWDSGFYNIQPATRGTITFNDFIGGATVPLTSDVPTSFTWSIQFQNLGVNAKVGVDLYSPPTIGDNFTDYWDFNGSSWSIKTGATDMSFGARLTVVPEPASYAALSGILLGAWGIYRRVKPGR
jgi:hypothetical protein